MAARKTQTRASEPAGAVRRGVPLLTRLANRYWRHGAGRVTFEELLGIGMRELTRAIDDHDPGHVLFEDYLAPRLHRAMQDRIARLPPRAPRGARRSA